VTNLEFIVGAKKRKGRKEKENNDFTTVSLGHVWHLTG
jgi:hypothetical protein